MLRVLLPLAVLVLSACPRVASTPCTEDTECQVTQRCRRGACGPLCESDSECGDAQVCANGVCALKPECAQDEDCATGFFCAGGQCRCSGDASCAANQTCENGTCVSRKRCTADADCIGTGGRCEVTQGLCLPVCVMPADCAPDLDPRVAFTIYTCVQGTCTRRCTTDAVCGGQGLICKAGLCTVAECKTKDDCPAGQYCTSETFGRCLAYETCSDTAMCPRNSECRAFTQLECPPGFDCGQKICQELPRCLVDADCVSGVPGAPVSMATGYCEEGHCQPTNNCTGGVGCATGRECVAELCVPKVCRGHAECGAGSACIDGACVSAPAPGDINFFRFFPTTATVEVGDTVKLTLIAFTLDGSSYPLENATFTVVDTMGQPSSAATVDATGLVTGVSAGVVKVRGSVMGSALNPIEAAVTVYPQVTSGRRVVVVDADTRSPLQGVTVWGCEDASCGTPSEIVTDVLGVADFPALGSGAATFTAVSPQLRSDGLPQFERVSVLGTQAADVYLPLRDNPAKAAAGFNAGFNFSSVSTTGTYWAGFVATSGADVPSMTPASLLGDTFFVELDGIGQRVPVPSPIVLYTSPAFGIPREVKPRSLGYGQAGLRFATGWGGRANLDQVLSLRSTDFLGYLGAFDYALTPSLTVPSKVLVPDTADVDGDGLCSSATKCPMGTEDVADWAHFAMASFQPSRQQRRRTEVVVGRVPGNVDQVLAAAVQTHPAVGMLPVGFASGTALAPNANGTRDVDPITLRSGAPYGGIEVAKPGVWVMGVSTQSGALTARLSHGATMPAKVQVTPFLPLPSGGTFNAATRTFNPGQPEWASVYSSGGELARVSITGAQAQHTLYFRLIGSQTAVVAPPTPAGPGRDPTTEPNAALEVVAVDLNASVSPDQLYTLSGVNLATWAEALDGYCRFDR